MALQRVSDISSHAIPAGSGARLTIEYADGRPAVDIDLTDEEAAAAVENGFGIRVRRAWSLAETRARHPRAYDRWTADEHRRLTEMHGRGDSIETISRTIGRQPGGVRSRLRKLGLLP